MAHPSIAVVNFTTTLKGNDVRAAIHGVNRQIYEQFNPIWGCARTLKPYVPHFDVSDPDTLAEERVPADSVIYLVDEPTLADALGFHDLNTRDLPFGFVFVLDPHDWTTTLSHEALELILDPTANVFVPGPDPRDAAKTVLHSYEACDAVERLSYPVGDVLVSDFVTPSYFTVGDTSGRQNDFLGVGLPSFGVTRGSHLGFVDLAVGQFVTFEGRQSPTSKHLLARAEAHDHPKRRRPEERIQQILSEYRSRTLRTGANGLRNIRGVTRTARYRASLGFAHA